MIKEEITEEELIAFFESYVEEHPKSKSSGLIRNLLECQQRWLPSITRTYMHRGNDTTNRVEGFFATSKNLNEHKILPLANLVESLFVQSDRQFILSRNTKLTEVPHYIISEEDSRKIGSIALSKIVEEYTKLTDHVLTNRYSPNCCNTHVIYGIPCRHLMLERLNKEDAPLLNITDFDQRWTHDYDTNILD